MVNASNNKTRPHYGAVNGINHLTGRPSWTDTDRVPEKEGAGFSSPNYSRRTTANGGIFSSEPCCTSYGAAVVGRLRPAGFLEYRSANPIIRRSTPFSSGASGSQPLLKEAHVPGTITPVLSHSESIRLISGVNVAQLLRDIDEASAGTNPVELFRLCLDAQRVLAQVQAGNTTTDEAKLLAAYRASDDDSRHFLQSAAQTLAQDFKRQRAHLMLVQSGQVERAEAV